MELLVAVLLITALGGLLSLYNRLRDVEQRLDAQREARLEQDRAIARLTERIRGLESAPGPPPLPAATPAEVPAVPNVVSRPERLPTPLPAPAAGRVCQFCGRTSAPPEPATVIAVDCRQPWGLDRALRSAPVQALRRSQLTDHPRQLVKLLVAMARNKVAFHARAYGYGIRDQGREDLEPGPRVLHVAEEQDSHRQVLGLSGRDQPAHGPRDDRASDQVVVAGVLAQPVQLRLRLGGQVTWKGRTYP